MDDNYSVLMSVYSKEKPQNLVHSMMSIYNQTIPTNDFVVVCDGPLGMELECVIRDMKKNFGTSLKVISLKENVGLGKALNVGLKYCKNELVARMDSDDISLPERCEKELSVLTQKKEIDVVGSNIDEFLDGCNLYLGTRKVPNRHIEILKFSRRRNPFNHPSVMFRKSSVIRVGGYEEKFHLFEDYHLWIKMFLDGSVGYNIEDSLLKMRCTNDMYGRRGGMKYAKDLIRFNYWLFKVKWIKVNDIIFNVVPHFMVCLFPNSLRKRIYRKFARN